MMHRHLHGHGPRLGWAGLGCPTADGVRIGPAAGHRVQPQPGMTRQGRGERGGLSACRQGSGSAVPETSTLQHCWGRDRGPWAGLKQGPVLAGAAGQGPQALMR